MRERGICVLALSLVAACAATEVDASRERADARELIRETTGAQEVFDPAAPVLTPAELESALADGLGLEEAQRLALLNNRRLQAGFLGLGVARAEFVQAGLIRNPSLGVAFLFPSGGGRPKLSFDLVQSLIDLWELPARRDVAEALLQQRVFELSRLAGELVVDTRDAYFESVAARELLATARESVQAASTAFDAVHRQVEAGVETVVEENMARGEVLSAQLALHGTERENFGARRRLAALLSLERDLMDVELTDALPEPASTDLDREAVVARSRSTRLDLRAAQAEIRAAAAQIELERRRTLPEVEASLALEHPERGSSIDALAGPGATIELPIFDRNAAQRSRAELRHQQLEREFEAAVAEVGQAVRAAVDRSSSAAQSARFVTLELLPQAERGFELARTSYELGDSIVLTLLGSQRAVLQARTTRIQALLEAALSRNDLERVAGTSLDRIAPPPR